MAIDQATASTVTVKDLLDAGLHFGHQTKRWNPKMKPFIFDKRNGIHLIDLNQSLDRLNKALAFVHEVVLAGQSVLFVGTKKQAQEIIKTTATACGQHYVTHRWLGGTLTNMKTIQGSIRRMREINKYEEDGTLDRMHKKEASQMRHEVEKLRRNVGGIANLGSLPGVMFVVDINREAIAVKEANTLGIPIVAVVDTNCDPDPIQQMIPGNDDSMRAIKLVCDAMRETIAHAGAIYSAIAAQQARKRQAEEATAHAARPAQASATAGEAAAKTAARARRAPAARRPARATTEKTAETTAPEAPATAAPAEASADAPVVEQA